MMSMHSICAWMAIAGDYADFFSSCGALRSVTRVDFML